MACNFYSKPLPNDQQKRCLLNTLALAARHQQWTDLLLNSNTLNQNLLLIKKIEKIETSKGSEDDLKSKMRDLKRWKDDQCRLDIGIKGEFAHICCLVGEARVWKEMGAESELLAVIEELLWVYSVCVGDDSS